MLRSVPLLASQRMPASTTQDIELPDSSIADNAADLTAQISDNLGSR